MSGFYRSLEYIGIKMNNAINTKQSIITAANSYEYVTQKVKEIQEKAWEEVKEEKVQNIHFDPNEVEAIVLKNKENKIIPNDKFKEKLKVKEQKKLEKEGKIVSIKTKDTNERDIG